MPCQAHVNSRCKAYQEKEQALTGEEKQSEEEDC